MNTGLFQGLVSSGCTADGTVARSNPLSSYINEVLRGVFVHGRQVPTSTNSGDKLRLIELIATNLDKGCLATALGQVEDLLPKTQQATLESNVMEAWRAGRSAQAEASRIRSILRDAWQGSYLDNIWAEAEDLTAAQLEQREDQMRAFSSMAPPTLRRGYKHRGYEHRGYEHQAFIPATRQELEAAPYDFRHLAQTRARNKISPTSDDWAQSFLEQRRTAQQSEKLDKAFETLQSMKNAISLMQLQKKVKGLQKSIEEDKKEIEEGEKKIDRLNQKKVYVHFDPHDPEDLKVLSEVRARDKLYSQNRLETARWQLEVDEEDLKKARAELRALSVKALPASSL